MSVNWEGLGKREKSFAYLAQHLVEDHYLQREAVKTTDRHFETRYQA
jgi:hypothetical protein